MRGHLTEIAGSVHRQSKCGFYPEEHGLHMSSVILHGCFSFPLAIPSSKQSHLKKPFFVCDFIIANLDYKMPSAVVSHVRCLFTRFACKFPIFASSTPRDLPRPLTSFTFYQAISCGRSPFLKLNELARYEMSMGSFLIVARRALSTAFWSAARLLDGFFFCKSLAFDSNPNLSQWTANAPLIFRPA